MSSTESPLKAWWGPHALPPPGEGLHWRIGPLSLWVRAWPGGWSVHCADSGDPVDEALIVAEPGLAPPEADRIRLASERLGGTVVLGARCPDRVIAVRPEIALTVLPGDRVTLFVGTAVWLTLGTEAGEVVHELPVYRPTDSWLGPDTRSGILAYAGRTSARTVLADLPPRPGRAVTRLTLVNSTRRPLAFERVVLPMPSLALYADPDHRLWTDDVTYELSADPEGTVRTAPPGSHPRMSPPRETSEGSAFRRAWEALFR